MPVDLHVVDLTGYYGAEPLEGFRTILKELDAHAADLAGKPQVILLNKIDAVPPAAVDELVAIFTAEVERLRQEGHPAFVYLLGDEISPARQLVWPISAATGAGLGALLRWVGPLLGRLVESESVRTARSTDRETSSLMSGEEVLDDQHGHVTYRPLDRAARTFVVHSQGEGFVVRGRAVRRLVSRFDLTNEEAIRYLGERLDRLGVYAALRAQGARPGDDVDIEGYAFEFH